MWTLPPRLHKMMSGAVLVLLLGSLYYSIIISVGTPLYYKAPPPPLQSNHTQDFPQAIIFGVRKGGTRALLEFIGEHPQVAAAHDEVHFFDRDEEYAKGLEWYRSNMPFAEPGQMTIEKTPAYFITKKAPMRIWQMNPRVRLLLIVRDPVTRVLSDYTQILSSRTAQNLSFSSFEELVIDPETSDINLSYKAVQISLYHQHFRRWLVYFPRSHIHIVDGDQLIAHPARELAKVENFLGLPHKLTSDMFYFNTTKGFYCMKRRISHEERCLGSSKGRKHPDIDKKVLRKLRKFYAPHNEVFFNLTGRTFDWPVR